MNAQQDPFVGRALDLLVPRFDPTPDELLLASQTGAARIRGARRRRRTAAVLAFAALLLFAGAALAAKKYDLLPFLHTNDRNSARFSVSPTRTYRGAAPDALVCPGARTGTFVCNVSSVMAPGNRRYQLGMRTDKVPLLTRQSMLAALDHAQGVDPAQVARVRAALARVDDAFIRALATLARIETVGGGSSGSSGTERVPPRGVPAWATCTELTLTTFRCRPLAALVGVPNGAPLYELQPSRDWRRVATPPSDNSNAFLSQLDRLLGRKPTAAESRFLVDFLAGAATTTASAGAGQARGGLIATSNPRRAALLAPGSLGVRTRVVSSTAQPLPPGRLPYGLIRSVGTRLYRVVFEVPRGRDAGQHTIYVYVTRRQKIGVWLVAWVGTKP